MAARSHTRPLVVAITLALAVGLAWVGPPASAARKDKGRIAFVRSHQIYTATTTGRRVRKLTSSGKNFQPQWSPNGRRIAFVHEGRAGHRDIWVMRANGHGKRRVTHLGDTTEPTWSPDGKWLAFGASGTPPYSSFNDYPLRKVRSRAPFGKPVVLPTGDDEARVAGTLAWSPNGKQIAFVSNSFPDSPDHYLLVYTLATRQLELVDEVGGSCCGEGYFADPAWTKDSSTIAYSVVRYDLEDSPPAGPHLEFATRGSGPLPSFPAVTGDSDPDYSPSGRKLVFQHFSRIYTANADGSRRHRVLAGTSPDWQPVR